MFGSELRCKECNQYKPDRCTRKEWASHAKWPLEVYKGADGKGISTDTHRTKEAAQIVCGALKAKGFGGMGELFPISTWVTEKT